MLNWFAGWLCGVLLTFYTAYRVGYYAAQREERLAAKKFTLEMMRKRP